MGARVDTMAPETSGNGIFVGGEYLMSGKGTLLLVVVNRANPLPAVTATGYVPDSNGVAKLASQLKALTSSSQPSASLVFVAATPNGNGPLDSGDVGAFAKAVAQIGAQVCSSKVTDSCLPTTALTGKKTGFSIIGVPGARLGSAWQAPGGLDGYLQLDQSGVRYTFVSSDYVPFKTSSSGTSATIQVGSTTRTGQLGSGETGGLAVALLDARTAQVVDFQMFPTNGGGGAEGGQTNLRNYLQSKALDPTKLVVVQSAGKPAGTTEEWYDVGRYLEQLGGNSDVVNRLNGQSYALVGGYQLEGSNGTEIRGDIPTTVGGSQAQGGSVGLKGVLSRHTDWRFQPDVSNPVLPPSNGTSPDVYYDLLPIAMAAPKPWPDADAAHAAANAWIAQQLSLCKPVQNVTDCSSADVRDYYVSDPDGFRGDNGGDHYDDLKNLNCPKSGQGFTQQDCTEMQGQLEKEFPIVARVRAHVGDPKEQGDLQTPFKVGQTTNSATLSSVTQSITNTVPIGGGNSEVGSNMIEAAAGVFFLASSIIAPEASLAYEAAAAGAAGSLLDVAGPFITTPHGENPLVGRLQTTAGQLATEATLYYTDAVKQYSHVADLIVSDWSKLQAADDLSGRDPSWSPPPGSATDAENAVETELKAGALQWFYSTLLPVSNAAWDLGQQQPATPYCQLGAPTYATLNPFKGSPPSSQYQFLTGFKKTKGGDQQVFDRWLLALRTVVQKNGGSALPEPFTKALFNPFDPDFDFGDPKAIDPPAGFYAPWLFKRSLSPPRNATSAHLSEC